MAKRKSFNFTEVTMWQCNTCQRIYRYMPEKCNCRRRYEPGRVVNAFQLLQKIPNQRWVVRCLLCDGTHEVGLNNILRTQSCGCKPRHVTLEKFDADTNTATLYCSRCQRTRESQAPVEFYCCASAAGSLDVK